MLLRWARVWQLVRRFRLLLPRSVSVGSLWLLRAGVRFFFTCSNFLSRGLDFAALGVDLAIALVLLYG